MQIAVYAVLKDYFDSNFEMDYHAGTISDVREKLLQLNPNAASLLSLSRFAVNEEIVGEDFKITAHDLISVLPPASGG